MTNESAGGLKVLADLINACGSFSASMENCTVSLEEFAQELIGVPEEPAFAIQPGSSTGHATQKCIHRPRNNFKREDPDSCV